jgi:hypothetical protein
MSTFYPVLSQNIWHGSYKGLNDHQVAIPKWWVLRVAKKTVKRAKCTSSSSGKSDVNMLNNVGDNTAL